VDTAGVDDEGALGEQRIEKTRQAIARTDIGVMVTEAGVWGEFEEKLLVELRAHNIPVAVALNKADLRQPTAEQIAHFRKEKLASVLLSATSGEGIEAFRELLGQTAPTDAGESPIIVRDLVPPGETAVLVMPIDKEAPKGRIKNLQVQAIRDLLDGESSCIVVKDAGLKNALDNMKRPPSLVVTDAQVFDQVARLTPKAVPLTAFSILLSRLKGDLVAQTRAAVAIDELLPGDRILIAETCTHHPIEEDIGRVKIPRWLEKHVGGKLEFTHVKGRDFPLDLLPYRLVVHCGACMWNRQEMMSRIRECHRQHVPITNYGLVIAMAQGILERALAPFPEALAAFHAARAASAGYTEADSAPGPAETIAVLVN
jgi:[FeFe] hydrogenase H-cluster maturation GTPase HydF